MLDVLYTFLLHTVKTAKINDFIDILIVAFVIYKAIKLLKETRAEQLVKGIVVLLVATQLSEWLQLNAINFILRNTMQVGVLALLVVFQPELRRALEQVGRSSLGSFLRFDDFNSDINIKESIEQMCIAADKLAKERIGALIVIERETKIGEIIKTGTAIDARINAELLQNIFFPKSPLHDGAIVIRNNKIAAANCYLPLSQDMTISRELGTRHRAAIGISENSDAVVIVVSEETGKISVALNGDLTRNLTVENLNKALNRILIASNEKNTDTNFILKKVRLKWKRK